MLDVLEQHRRDEGAVDLGLHGVLGCPHERLDFEVLLERLEEEFDLPAALVHLRDCRRTEREVVCNEDEIPVLRRVVVHDSAEVRAPVALRASEDNDVIRNDSPVFSGPRGSPQPRMPNLSSTG